MLVYVAVHSQKLWNLTNKYYDKKYATKFCVKLSFFNKEP